MLVTDLAPSVPKIPKLIVTLETSGKNMFFSKPLLELLKVLHFLS